LLADTKAQDHRPEQRHDVHLAHTDHRPPRARQRAQPGGRKHLAQDRSSVNGVREPPGPAPSYRRREDETVTRSFGRFSGNGAGSYGYRRASVVVNLALGTGYNRKRIQRVMRMYGLTLPARERHRNGRRHRGLIRQDVPNRRWCSDVIEIAC